MNENSEKPPKAPPKLTLLCLLWGGCLSFKLRKNTVPAYEPPSGHQSALLGPKLESAWNKEILHGHKPSFFKTLAGAFGPEIAIFGLLNCLLQVITTVATPVLFYKLLEHYTFHNFHDINQEFTAPIYIYTGCFIIVVLAQILAVNFFKLLLKSLELRVQTACFSLIYRRLLKLNKGAQEYGTKELRDVFSSVGQLKPGFLFIHQLWIGPLQCVVSLLVADYFIGHSALAGFVIVILFSLTQVGFIKSMDVLHRQIASKSHIRGRLISSVIQGIRIIKLNTWEGPYLGLIETARKLELNEMYKYLLYSSIGSSVKTPLLRASLFAAILTSILLNSAISPALVCSLTLFYYFTQKTLVQDLPFGLLRLSQSIATIDKIENFLLFDFFPNYKNNSKPKKHVTFALNPQAELDSNQKPGLYAQNTDLGLSLETSQVKNQKIGFCGPDASKFIGVFLRKTFGVHVEGSISYASEVPWIFSGTLKDNIVFKQSFDISRYKKVIYVCGLETEISRFPEKDLIFLGPGGTTLTPGQKSRVNLARAVYKDSDIYIFDQPLTMMKPETTHHIITECFSKFLKDKILAVSSQDPKILKLMDQIHFCENDTIVASGTFQDLQDLQYLQNFDARITSQETLKQGTQTDKTPKTTQGLLQKFVKSGGDKLTLVGAILSFIFVQFIVILLDCFTLFWAKEGVEQEIHASRLDHYEKNLNIYFLIGYGVVVAILLVIIVSRLSTFLRLCLQAAKNLHDILLTKVLSSELSYFDTNSGHIQKTFLDACTVVDKSLPRSLMNVFETILFLFGLGLVTSIVNYWLIIPSVVIFLLVIGFGRVFAQNQKIFLRHKQKNDELLYGQFLETIDGLDTIKSSNVGQFLQDDFEKNLDKCGAISYLECIFKHSASFWIDFAAFLYFIVVLSITVFACSDPAERAGIAILLSIFWIETSAFYVRNLGKLATDMESLQSLFQYADIPMENAHSKEIPPDFWPQNGDLTFQSVSVKYTTGSNALKNISFQVNSGEKIGILGYPGSGKSSLISALLRLVAFDGKITLDGIETRNVALKDLRSKIPMVPANPMIFWGSTRRNLDPDNQFDDTELWSALDDVELKYKIPGLDTSLEDQEKFFTMEDKQLLHLARLKLLNPKVVVLEENPEVAGELIQKIVKEQFQDVTVLILLRNLENIEYCDRILLLDGGEVAEFGAPKTLISDKNSSLYRFLEEFGGSLLAELISKWRIKDPQLFPKRKVS